MERDLDSQGAHFLRERVTDAFDSLKFFDSDQLGAIQSIAGEAIDNAVKHSTGDRVTSLRFTELERGALLQIVNSSDRLPDATVVSVECSLSDLPECGYGRHLIDGEVEVLRQSGVRVDCHYRFEPEEGSNRGQTIFHLSVCG